MYVAHIESISSACIIRILRRECISLYVAVQKDLISDLKKKKAAPSVNSHTQIFLIICSILVQKVFLFTSLIFDCFSIGVITSTAVRKKCKL